MGSLRQSVRARMAIRFLLSCGLGAAVGLVVFVVAQAGGLAVVVVGGAVVGGAIGLFRLRGYRDAQLSEVTIGVPNLSQIRFVVNSAHRATAWRFFIETSTRVATQPLAPSEGRLKEALASLYSLFSTVRAQLLEMGPSPITRGATVELLAFRMLNFELRPFLSKWHPLLDQFHRENPSGDESHWELNDRCREELEEMRGNLLAYARDFGKLSNVAELDKFFPLDVPPAQGEAAT